MAWIRAMGGGSAKKKPLIIYQNGTFIYPIKTVSGGTVSISNGTISGNINNRPSTAYIEIPIDIKKYQTLHIKYSRYGQGASWSDLIGILNESNTFISTAKLSDGGVQATFDLPIVGEGTLKVGISMYSYLYMSELWLE